MTSHALQHETNLATVLKRLLREHGVNANILEKRTGIPRSTIRNILNGKTTDPRISTLNTIADYFGITSDQLLAKEPLENKPAQVIQQIPIIAWDKANTWQQTIKQPAAQEQHIESVPIPVDVELEETRFALKVFDDAMWPRYQVGNVLIIAPEKTAKNRDFVIVHLRETNATVLRQLYIDDDSNILRAADSSYPDIVMNEHDCILGVVIQTIAEQAKTNHD